MSTVKEQERAREIERLLAYSRSLKNAESGGTPLVASGGSENSNTAPSSADVDKAAGDIALAHGVGLKTGGTKTDVSNDVPAAATSGQAGLPQEPDEVNYQTVQQAGPTFNLSYPGGGAAGQPSATAEQQQRVAGNNISNTATGLMNAGLGAYGLYSLLGSGGAAAAGGLGAGALGLGTAQAAAAGGGAGTGSGLGASMLAMGQGQAGTVAAAEPSMFSLSNPSIAGRVGQGALGAYGMYDTMANRGGLFNNYDKPRTVMNVGRGLVQGAGSGALLGNSIVPGGPGAAVGAIAGGLTGLVGSLVHKGNRAHIARSESRKELSKVGIVEASEKGPYNITNSDGSKFPMLDGKDVPAGQQGVGYNLDLSNPLSGQAAGYGDVISALFLGGNNSDGILNSYSGYFGNAMMMAAANQDELRREALFQFNKLGISFEQARGMITQLVSSGKIDKAHGDAYINTLNVMESGKGYTEGSVNDMANKPQPGINR